MREPLNIPFSRSHTATRRPRRVVWTFLVPVILVLVVFLHASTLWFTRGIVFAAAPESTIYAFQLLINKKTLPVLERVLLKIPLITGRDLTISDLAPLTRGQIGWFFHEDGSRSVALRASKVELPLELFDAKQIAVQEVNAGLSLISETLQPVGGISTKRTFLGLLPVIRTRIGQFWEKGSKRSQPIVFFNGRFDVRLPASDSDDLEVIKDVPIGTFAVLSTPVFTNRDIYRSLPVPEKVFSTPGVVALSDPEDPSFFVRSELSMNEGERLLLIRTILSEKNTEKKPFVLQDDTVAQEQFADPDLISLEERAIAGKIFYHGTTGDDSLFLSKDGEFILSDKEETLKKWLAEIKEGKKMMECDANIAFANLKQLIETGWYATTYYSTHPFYALADSFEAMGIKKSGKMLKLSLCI